MKAYLILFLLTLALILSSAYAHKQKLIYPGRVAKLGTPHLRCCLTPQYRAP